MSGLKKNLGAGFEAIQYLRILDLVDPQAGLVEVGLAPEWNVLANYKNMPPIVVQNSSYYIVFSKSVLNSIT